MKNILRQVFPRLSNLKNTAALLLFASLSHSLALAECGPYGEGQCRECGPHWSDWYAEQCPTNSNTTSVTPSWYGCVQTGQSPPQPTVIPPTFGGGRKARVAWYDCSTNLNYQYGGITYSVGAVQWDPPLPGTFGVQHVPYFSSWAYVDVTSSDTNLCASPGRWYIGSCTWAVVDASIHLTSAPYEWTPDWAANFANVAGGFASLPVTINPIAGYDQVYSRGYCCSNSPSYVDYEKRGVNAGTVNLNVDIGSATLKSMAEGIVGSALDGAGLNVPGLASAVTSWIDLNANLSAGSLTAAGTANFYDVIGYTDSCHCPGDWGGWYGVNRIAFNRTIGTVQMPASVFQAFGINASLNITALAADLEYKIHGYDSYIGPATTDIPHFVDVRRKSSIYTHYQIGTFEDTYYWSGPTDDTTSSESTICHGENYPS